MDYQSFFSILSFIDGVTIIDTSGIIIFSINFNPEKTCENCDTDEVVGKKLSEVFPNIKREKSTLFEAMERGIPVFKNRQSITTAKGDCFSTMNVSIPIRISNRIVGAVELSRYLGTGSEETDSRINFTKDIFNTIYKQQNLLGNDRACYELSDIITDDPEMHILKTNVMKFADSTSPIFIFGETGTGKELFAHAIHNSGKRKGKPFIAQNCAAIPETLLESILFGTARGSFTGAVESPGLFEAANGGTLFLDEINSMPVHLQTKLLRVLQNGCVRRVGGQVEKKIDVRIISAAGTSPEECLKQNTLRHDIYYRLCVLVMHIPPLRKRTRDIQILLHYFIAKYNNVLNTSIQAVSNGVVDTFMEYSWPGNIRELEHLVEYALHMVESGETTLRFEHICQRFHHFEATSPSSDPEENNLNMKDQVHELESRLMLQALDETDWNYSQAARKLGINRQTLQNKIKQYELRQQ